MKRPVLNGGVIYGKPDIVAHFCLLVWSNGLKSDCSDQAVINYVANFVEPHISSPVTESFCITGEGVKEGFVQIKEQDAVFYNPQTNDKYKIFHQWDRTVYADKIRQKYGV